jgi:hypothetical protein
MDRERLPTRTKERLARLELAQANRMKIRRTSINRSRFCLRSSVSSQKPTTVCEPVWPALVGWREAGPAIRKNSHRFVFEVSLRWFSYGLLTYLTALASASLTLFSLLMLAYLSLAACFGYQGDRDQAMRKPEGSIFSLHTGICA